MGQSKGVILFQSGFYSGGEGPALEFDLGKGNVASGAPTVTILFIPLSAAQYNLESDWADAGTKVIVRHCPICVQDSIVGHGCRRKQAHDEHHDWNRDRGKLRGPPSSHTTGHAGPHPAVRRVKQSVSQLISESQASRSKHWATRC